MNAENRDVEAIGTFVRYGSGEVVLQLADGSEVVCRGVKRMYRKYHIFVLREGMRFRIRYTRGPDRMPLLIEPVADDPVE